MVIPLPGQQKCRLTNSYLPMETSNFLQRVGFSDSEFQTELQQFEIICADLNAHDQLLDPVARPTERRIFRRRSWMLMVLSLTLAITLAMMAQQMSFLLWMSTSNTSPFSICAIGHHVTFYLQIIDLSPSLSTCQPNSYWDKNDWSGIGSKAIFQHSPTKLKTRYLRSARAER